MNREIKFRAWNNQIFEMWDCDHLILNRIVLAPSGVGFLCPDEDGYLVKMEHLTSMQYTGIKDKNGKEIYEGDIVEWKFNGEVRRYITFWDDTCGRWLSKTKIEHFVHGSFSEIIGNIYEHPEPPKG